VSIRPSIDEYDAGSYLEARLTGHDVKRIDPDGALRCDGSPSYAHDELNLAPALCRTHAYDLARTLGFTGPETHHVSYQPWLSPQPEDVMVLRAAGRITAVADYGYGRAYFEPGEPRTMPCAICGAETLRDWLDLTP
jgi:hypothetical protein